MNPATLWAQTLVEEFYRAGLRRVVIAPGSRSTPLTMAFVAHPGVHHFIHLDERSAAFFALGLALASGQPAALVCTSGTAAAEFFPAVVEASQSDVPLLLLTADRPPELRHSGANQTIDQRRLYGAFARWSVDLPLPESAPSLRLLRSLRTLADRALAVAQGLNGVPGPVHLNVPFRKPLEPTGADAPALAPSRRDNAPWTRIHLAPRAPLESQLDALAERLKDARRGLIVAGPRTPAHRGLDAAIYRLARRTGWPVLADPLSNLRFGPSAPETVIGGYALGLANHADDDLLLPDVVLRFGAMPTANALNSWLAALPPDVPQIGVEAHGRWHDGDFSLSELLACDERLFCDGLTKHLTDFHPDSSWLVAWQEMDDRVQATLDAASEGEGALVRSLFAALPEQAQVVVANSLPIRHVDEFVPVLPTRLRLFGNRGASGIDGTVSTALGVAAASGQPVVLLTGDLSFFHDQNGLLALREEGVKLDIVLLNNDGGGIFHRLPVSRFEPPFTQAFVTPHGLDFSHATRQYGLVYRRLEPRDAPEALRAALAAPASHLLEIHTDAATSETLRQHLLTTLRLMGPIRPKDQSN